MENSGNTSAKNNAGAQSGSNLGSVFGSAGIGSMLGNLNVQDMWNKYSGTATKAIGRLSTTQKVIGGALLLLGAGYLTRKAGPGFMNKNGSTKSRK